MTGQDWIKLIRDSRESILAQLRPYWKDYSANCKAGVEVLLYLQSDGTIAAHTRTAGSSSWRQSPDLLPLGDGSMRPTATWTEADYINHVIESNALHDW